MFSLNQLLSHPGLLLHQPVEAPRYTTQLYVWAINLRLPVYRKGPDLSNRPIFPEKAKFR